MKRTAGVQVLAIVAACLAALVSYQLLDKHLTGSTGPSWFAAGCSAGDDESSADCAAVLASPYSYWPPKKDDEPAGTPHIPVAFLGLVYFSMLAVWLIGVGRPSSDRRKLHWVPFIFSVFGLLGSARFLLIMFVALEQWCPWCLLTHFLNGIIFVCLILMWPSKRQAAVPSGSDDNKATPDVPLTASQPTGRTVFITAIAVVLVAFGQNQLLGNMGRKKAQTSLTKNYQRCMAAVKNFKGDSELLFQKWFEGKKFPVTIRPDDPMRTVAMVNERLLNVVVFSDLECPVCRKFANFLEDQVQPLFAHRLRIVFKHYPLSPDCNKFVRNNIHPAACLAATMAEVGRSMRESDGFWLVHDMVFKRHSDLKAGKITWADVEILLGVPEGSSKSVRDSEQISQRLVEDVALARTCSVNATPAVFVTNKRVEQLAILELGFWDKLSDRYWKTVGQARPPETKRPEKGATQDTPNPKAAP